MNWDDLKDFMIKSQELIEDRKVYKFDKDFINSVGGGATVSSPAAGSIIQVVRALANHQSWESLQRSRPLSAGDWSFPTLPFAAHQFNNLNTERRAEKSLRYWGRPIDIRIDLGTPMRTSGRPLLPNPPWTMSNRMHVLKEFKPENDRLWIGGVCYLSLVRSLLMVHECITIAIQMKDIHPAWEQPQTRLTLPCSSYKTVLKSQHLQKYSVAVEHLQEDLSEPNKALKHLFIHSAEVKECPAQGGHGPEKGFPSAGTLSMAAITLLSISSWKLNTLQRSVWPVKRRNLLESSVSSRQPQSRSVAWRNRPWGAMDVIKNPIYPQSVK